MIVVPQMCVWHYCHQRRAATLPTKGFDVDYKDTKKNPYNNTLEISKIYIHNYTIVYNKLKISIIQDVV